MNALLAAATPPADYWDQLSTVTLIVRIIVGATFAAHGYKHIFLGGKLAELQGAPCSISGTGKLPKIDAAHLPTLLAAINKQLGK